MSKIRKFFQYLYLLIIFAPVIIYNHVFYISRYAKHPEKYPLNVRYARLRKEIRILFKLWKISYHTIGWNNYADSNKKCIFLSNHMSDIDPLLLIAMSEKPITFVAKIEIKKYPFIGKCLKSINGIFIDRHNIMNQIDTIREIVSKAKDENMPNIAIFIEGTRNKNPEGNVLEYKAGTVKTAYMSGVDIIPVSLYSTFRVLNLKNYLHRYPVYYHFDQRISKEEYKAINNIELANRLENNANNIINNKLRALDKEFISKSKISNRIKKLEIKVDR